MEKYFFKKATDTIKVTKAVVWIIMILGLINWYFLQTEGNYDQYGNLYMPLYERIFIIASSIIGGVLIIYNSNKLHKEIPNISYYVFELKYMKFLLLYFIWAGIFLLISSIEDKNIIKGRAYLLSSIIIIIGVGFFLLSKYWLRKKCQN